MMWAVGSHSGVYPGRGGSWRGEKGSAWVPRLTLNQRLLATAPTQEPGRTEAPPPLSHTATQGKLPLPPTSEKDLRATLT